ncbi:LapA family protein [Corynebacterium aquilae]|uniref:Lipopolysaccharide assembly protein A domain-containing protein n=1 Tax=Corynebacterium aquilae DSM 44791 TaxID=1431546 RepID=A0A1L7CGN0_9CORY|nr:lipopolysaccharide assembly protein LapA domain-containing protein [Corynebacterium aquilae]APT84996.1 hypothetical protein CAQU_07830 [Corynebacterium aquilae DSM 44791]
MGNMNNNPEHPDFGEPEDHLPDTRPATDHGPVEPVVPAPTDDAAPAPQDQKKPKVKGSVAGGTWVALILGLLLLIALLVFILQNQNSVELTMFAWSFSVPVGVGFLLAAIAGALIMALVGGVRMLELRRQVKRAKKL